MQSTRLVSIFYRCISTSTQLRNGARKENFGLALGYKISRNLKSILVLMSFFPTLYEYKQWKSYGCLIG